MRVRRSWWRMSYDRELTPEYEAEFPEQAAAIRRLPRPLHVIIFSHRGRTHLEGYECWGDRHDTRGGCRCMVWDHATKAWVPWLKAPPRQ